MGRSGTQHKSNPAMTSVTVKTAPVIWTPNRTKMTMNGTRIERGAEMANDISRELSKALKRVDPEYARVVLDSMTNVETYDAPFLTYHRIYRVEEVGPHHSKLFYVGFAPGERAYLLTGAPDQYVRLAHADRVDLATPKAAEEYAAAYLEVTRSMSELFYVVHSIDDVMIRPNLDDEDAAAATAFAERYAAIITSPSAKATNAGYEVTVYAVREQALEQHNVTVAKDGALREEIVILEDDLPLVYGL